MKLRPMTTEDIDFALDLTKKEGWSDIKGDFSSLISYSPVAAFVLEKQGNPVGMISAASYGQIGFIGSLIVSQTMRNRGMGEHLLKFAIEHLKNQGVSCIMLDAVPDAMYLYSKNGFSPICKSLRLSGLVIDQLKGNVKQITEDDLSSIFEMDNIAFGGDRSHFLKAKWKQNMELCVCIKEDDVIIAFAMGSPREGHVRVAPWIVMQENELNGDLLKKIAATSTEKNLALGILETNTNAVSLTTSIGLAQYSFSVRMVLHDASMIKGDSQYAIGSPAKG